MLLSLYYQAKGHHTSVGLRLVLLGAYLASLPSNLIAEDNFKEKTHVSGTRILGTALETGQRFQRGSPLEQGLLGPEATSKVPWIVAHRLKRTRTGSLEGGLHVVVRRELPHGHRCVGVPEGRPVPSAAPRPRHRFAFGSRFSVGALLLNQGPLNLMVPNSRVHNAM